MLRRYRPLLAVLLISSLLRVALVTQGGQLYWPDERRYVQVLDAWQLPYSTGEAIGTILGSPIHLGFSIIAIVPAALHDAAARLSGRHHESIYEVPALLLSQLSVAALALVYAIVRRTGGDALEAMTAVTLMAGAASMLYPSRHLLPYDSAMVLGLSALWVGLGPPSARRFAACGALAAATFVTYNGYWLLIPVVVIVPLSRVWPLRRLMLRGAASATLGFIAVPAIIEALQLVAGQPPLHENMQRIAGAVTDGYAPEGFLLPWAYLWHAEHGLLVVWVVAAAAVLTSWSAGAREHETGNRQRIATLWFGVAAAIYLGLAGASAMLHVFVAMGRQTRQMVPFLCLGAAPVIVHVIRRTGRPRLWAAVAAGLLVAQAGWNARTPLEQRFPRDLVNELRAVGYMPMASALTVEGPDVDGGDAGSRWVAVNMAHLYPPRAAAPALAGTTVVRFPHPLEYLPYQYEGFDPIQRRILRSTDISMRLLDVAPGAGVASGPSDGAASQVTSSNSSR